MAFNGVMFHHFHSDAHPVSQGSISAEELDELIDFVAERRSILAAAEYAERASLGTLRDNDTCLTFDDALRCQVDVAQPVLESRGLTGFFFVYSSAFTGDPDPLEIYRHFRTSCFESVDDFYREFHEVVGDLFPGSNDAVHDQFESSSYLSEFAYYSVSDRRFRFMRDEVLSKEQYKCAMAALMDRHVYSAAAVAEALYMHTEDVTELASRGHLVGLHSDTHPTSLPSLDRDEQLREYATNFRVVSQITGVEPTWMSHPCGKYSDATLNILRDLGITLGFRSSMAITTAPSMLEVPREDHANLMRELRA